jgi:hypothetical protein
MVVGGEQTNKLSDHDLLRFEKPHVYLGHEQFPPSKKIPAVGLFPPNALSSHEQLHLQESTELG